MFGLLGMPYQSAYCASKFAERGFTEALRQELRATAADAGIESRIRFGHRVRRAEWSSETARWAVQADTPAGLATLSCGFLLVCSGYYRYDEGFRPAWEGIGDFRGVIVHPQHWPADLDYAGKRVVVIGSGATAVTLVPAPHGRSLPRSP